MMKFIPAFVAAAVAAATVGTASPATAQNYYLGQSILVGYTFCPRGTMPADGRLLQISPNTALFSLFGTTFGGDGRTTFALPNTDGNALQKGLKYCVVTEGVYPSRS